MSPIHDNGRNGPWTNMSSFDHAHDKETGRKYMGGTLTKPRPNAAQTLPPATVLLLRESRGDTHVKKVTGSCARPKNIPQRERERERGSESQRRKSRVREGETRDNKNETQSRWRTERKQESPPTRSVRHDALLRRFHQKKKRTNGKHQLEV